MKTKNYSRLLLTFVSSISMATTVGLSAKPGLSYNLGDQCIYIYEKTREWVEFLDYTDNTFTYAYVYFLYRDETAKVLVNNLFYCE